MPRFPTFLILGPLLGALLFLGLFSTKAEIDAMFAQGQVLYSVFFTFGVLLIPMLLLAGADQLLSRYRWRAIATGLIGFGFAVALMAYGAWEGGSEKLWANLGNNWYLIGLVLALPAAVCSWLSGRRTTAM